MVPNVLDEHADARDGVESDPSVDDELALVVEHIEMAAKEKQRIRMDHRAIAHKQLGRLHELAVQKPRRVVLVLQ